MDVLGLVIAVTVLAASAYDNAAGIALLDQVAKHAGGTVGKALVDQGFKNQVAAHGTLLGIDVETVQRNPWASRLRTPNAASAPVVHQALVGYACSACWQSPLLEVCQNLYVRVSGCVQGLFPSTGQRVTCRIGRPPFKSGA
ncbi:hypothetical protein OG622_31920 [Streptomyces sp. NBC_01314]|nr:hypothetical protein OG622_31920 [Streptomyces sp. NBC_01314]